ncbi:putative exported protein [Salmonella enterica subsp. arizonae]|nr:putative exported protein [Salmonella enterica subsp. arizonae]
MPITSGGWTPSRSSSKTDEFKKQRDLRGLFEFDMTGQQLDDYVKKQVTDYREQAKAFGLAK